MSTEQKVALGKGIIAKEATEVFSAHFGEPAPARLHDASRFVDEKNVAGCNTLWRMTVEVVNAAVAQADDVDVVTFDSHLHQRVVGKLPDVSVTGVWSAAMRELIGEDRWMRLHEINDHE